MRHRAVLHGNFCMTHRRSILNMKSLVIALLLFVFSVQGMGMAAGINVLDASRPLACAKKHDALASASVFASEEDIEALKIFCIAEELSDYVALEPALTSLRHHTPSNAAAAWIPVSIILPLALPPPRS